MSHDFLVLGCRDSPSLPSTLHPDLASCPPHLPLTPHRATTPQSHKSITAHWRMSAEWGLCYMMKGKDKHAIEFSRNSWQCWGPSHRLLISTEYFDHIKCSTLERESQTLKRVEVGGGRVWVGIIWRYFKVLGRKGGTEEEGRREGARGRGGGVREGTDFITSFNSLAQPVLRYVLLTPFWQMHANSNPFLSSSFPTAILQFKADL